MTNPITPTDADLEGVRAYLRDIGEDIRALNVSIGNLDDSSLVQTFARRAAAARMEGARAMQEACARTVAGNLHQRDSAVAFCETLVDAYSEGCMDAFESIHSLDPNKVLEGR